jgi:hypothetical protein
MNVVDARGPGQGTEILTGVLVATVCDPSGSGPSVRLIYGFHFQAPSTSRASIEKTRSPTQPIVAGRAQTG